MDDYINQILRIVSQLIVLINSLFAIICLISENPCHMRQWQDEYLVQKIFFCAAYE